MNDVAIYTLSDPRTDEVRYIGRTVQWLSLRRGQHIDSARRGKGDNSRTRWIRSLLDEGVEPEILLIERVPVEDWHEAEDFWIGFYRSFGLRLTNEAPAGGGGTRSHVVKWTPELDALLGTVADAIIAEDLDVCRKTVSYRRRKLGIAASYDPSRMKPPPPQGGWNRIELPPSVIERLGTAPDYVLAAEVGVTKQVVARARHTRGIAPYAAQSGNDGRYKDGHYPTRWLK